MKVGIAHIEYYLPEQVLTNDELALIYPEWSSEKIFEKTGIKTRHISDKNESVADMAVKASQKLFSSGVVKPEEIDFVILATQTPDYLLPTTACLVQDRLNIPHSAGALDINLGCSAYIYGLALSKGLIQSKIANKILFITSEAYTKHMDPMDKNVRTIFGDGAAASLIDANSSKILEFDLGTDGSGYDKLILPNDGNLFMDGPEIFNFTIDVVPKIAKKLLQKNQLDFDEIDLFVFHQANKFMLDYLRKKIKIPENKFYINMEDTGNLVSASIPVAFKRALEEKKIKKSNKIMLVGFGVGLSWGGVIIEY